MRVVTKPTEEQLFQPVTIEVTIHDRDELMTLFFIGGLDIRIPDNVPRQYSAIAKRFVQALRGVVDQTLKQKSLEA